MSERREGPVGEARPRINWEEVVSNPNVQEHLRRRHREVLYRRLGVEGRPMQTVDQIADEFHVEPERISFVERQARRKALRVFRGQRVR